MTDRKATGARRTTSRNTSRIPHQITHHDIIFTGSGGEYLRIWIVNLLLTVVTLGLYHPWATLRKLQYFHSNTVVAGYPLAFHAEPEPRKWLRGPLLVGALTLVYAAATKHATVATGLAGLVIAAIWPGLWCAALRSRMANTSWRGLRFQFKGTTKGAYVVLMTPVAVIVALAASAGLLNGQFGTLGAWMSGSLLVVVTLVLAPYAWWRLKRFEHDQYALGSMGSQFKASYRQVLGVFLRTALVALASWAPIGATIAAMAPDGGLNIPQIRNTIAWLGQRPSLAALLILGALVAQLTTMSYFTSRMHNLIWTKTGNRQLRFRGHMRFLSLLKLNGINLVLTALTLGLYWPFAAISLTRSKLHALDISRRKNAEQIMIHAQTRGQTTRATPAFDKTSDLIGMEVGL
jgi:uncharacterized membrane protein YjgN (DUF898 family)